MLVVLLFFLKDVLQCESAITEILVNDHDLSTQQEAVSYNCSTCCFLFCCYHEGNDLLDGVRLVRIQFEVVRSLVNGMLQHEEK
ncbi:hypothetical protein BDQ12DRAFT_672516 [Crucibulum laeve]|uniref:Secreted protein n=1 Tax=Crucibulum laeve TaxID=68775 RepID=A0A5C3MS63_9AGAR|nr:hypothetical protein BDQ12DRAFT_672516 [Crucibulum laeve]